MKIRIIHMQNSNFLGETYEYSHCKLYEITVPDTGETSYVLFDENGKPIFSLTYLKSVGGKYDFFIYD